MVSITGQDNRVWWTRGTFLGLLCLFMAAPLQAEESTLKFGFGVEGNMNTSEGYALAQTLVIEGQWFKYVVTGFELIVSSDFNQYISISPGLFGRWYFYDLGFKDGGFFVQANLGATVVLDEWVPRPFVLAGVTSGFRLPYLQGDYYVEPYLRVGYPYLWGGGVKAGCRL
jgi:hypothetical protein